MVGGDDVEKGLGAGWGVAEMASEVEAGEMGDVGVWEEVVEGEAMEVAVGDEDEGLDVLEVGLDGRDVEDFG